MRVIAGTARGRSLQGPRSSVTRPTSDLVRGAIFSMLEARGALFGQVLDLYAGTGALAIEALSRGADEAVLVERDHAACRVIGANLDKTGQRDRARVICAALPGALARLPDGPYSLVFLDPPYAAAGVGEVLDRLGTGTLLGPESTIVYEHDRRTMPPESCGALRLALTRTHGDTAVSLYESDDGDGG